MKKGSLLILLLTISLLSGCQNTNINSSHSNTMPSSSTASNSLSSSSSSNSSSTSTTNPSEDIEKEELDQLFEEEAYIPLVITSSISLPQTLPTYHYPLEWEIIDGQETLNLSNFVLSLKDNDKIVDGVHAIQVSIDVLDYQYTYYCTSHHQNYHQLPIIDIHTENEAFPENKEDYVNGTISVINYENEEYSIDILNAEMGIRLRGNSTMAALKKPFRIKFEEKQSLFGLPKAKSWVLLANYYDKSNIRNYLAYTFANQLDNLDFQPSSIFVEVRFNDDFLGLYLLSEHMQSGEGRVDIEDDVDSQGYPSYFFELNERADDAEENLTEDVDYFITDYSKNFIYEYKYPEGATAEQNQYIKNYMMETDQAIMNLDNYEEYIDVDSFIDYYIVQELFKNVDVGSTSQYYVKYANGKLHMGPVWDFDISLGVIGGPDYNRYLSTDLWVRERDYWYNSLFNDSAFLTRVQQRYTQVHDLILNVYNSIDDLTESLQEAQEANLQRWPLSYLNNPDLWIETHYHENYSSLTSLEQHYTYLKDHLSARIDILDQAYLL